MARKAVRATSRPPLARPARQSSLSKSKQRPQRSVVSRRGSSAVHSLDRSSTASSSLVSSSWPIRHRPRRVTPQQKIQTILANFIETPPSHNQDRHPPTVLPPFLEIFPPSPSGRDILRQERQGAGRGLPTASRKSRAVFSGGGFQERAGAAWRPNWSR